MKKLFVLLCAVVLTMCTKTVDIEALSKQTDPERFVQATRKYPDGRIGGIDWTTPELLPVVIEEQRSWPKCLKCNRVTQKPLCVTHR